MLVQTETKYNPATGKSGNLELPMIDVAEINNGKIVITNSLSIKEELKNLGYRYDANRQAWYFPINKDTVKNELTKLDNSTMKIRLGTLSIDQYNALRNWFEAQ